MGPCPPPGPTAPRGRDAGCWGSARRQHGRAIVFPSCLFFRTSSRNPKPPLAAAPGEVPLWEGTQWERRSGSFLPLFIPKKLGRSGTGRSWSPAGGRGQARERRGGESLSHRRASVHGHGLKSGGFLGILGMFCGFWGRFLSFWWYFLLFFGCLSSKLLSGLSHRV